MEMAPPRHGPALDIRPTNPPTDWAPRAGLYPITALKFMRLAAWFHETAL